MTEEEQKRMEEVTIAIREVICIKQFLEAYRNQTIAQIILSITDANGQPLLVPLHPDQRLPLVDRAIDYPGAMKKIGWRRVILPAGKDG